MEHASLNGGHLHVSSVLRSPLTLGLGLPFMIRIRLRAGVRFRVRGGHRLQGMLAEC